MISLSDFEQAAREKLSANAWEYLAGGAGDELTLRRNCAAFDAISLLPKVLRDVSVLDTSLELLGLKLAHPILLAPTAYQGLYHSDAECETARGAVRAEAVYVVSTMTNRTIEEIAAAARNEKQLLLYQLYVQRNREYTQRLIERVERAGCKALVITVDTPILGLRYREMRAGFQLPAGLDRAMLRDVPEAQGITGHQTDSDGIYYPLIDAAMTWDDIQWMMTITKLPIVLKGILHPDDAERAVQIGAAGIIVSNHGARNLDTVPATIEALPAIARKVNQQIPILFDGGIRRGTDVIKALALGANAVLIGRPYCWGLAVNGAAGVESVVRMLVRELKMAMALCGRKSLAEIGAELIFEKLKLES